MGLPLARFTLEMTNQPLEFANRETAKHRIPGIGPGQP
jgi:hypothetical protein